LTGIQTQTTILLITILLVILLIQIEHAHIGDAKSHTDTIQADTAMIIQKHIITLLTMTPHKDIMCGDGNVLVYYLF